jgi:hypothetical protein
MKKILILLVTATMSMAAIAQQTAQPKPATTQSKPKNKITPEERAQRKADLLKNQLQLNNDQTIMIKNAMVERNNALKAIRAKVGENQDAFRKEAFSVRKKFHDDMKKILSTEQFNKFKEMRKANRRPEDSKTTGSEDYIDESELDLRKVN